MLACSLFPQAEKPQLSYLLSHQGLTWGGHYPFPPWRRKAGMGEKRSDALGPEPAGYHLTVTTVSSIMIDMWTGILYSPLWR